MCPFENPSNFNVKNAIINSKLSANEKDGSSAKLVLIRGNSGSGKSSLAQKLQNHYGKGCLLISQDIIRRTMLKEKVTPDNLSISLTETIAHYGYEHNLLVLLEGFYEKDIYGDMLTRLRDLFAPHISAYYYDVTFAETVKRHRTRSKSADFSPADMKRWWVNKDFLGWQEEILWSDDISLQQAFEQVQFWIDRQSIQ